MSKEYAIEHRQKAKPAPKAPYYVMVKWKNNPVATKLYVKSTAPKTMEVYLKNRLHLWENAHLGNSVTGQIYHYYHPSQYQMAADQHRLSKEQYRRLHVNQKYFLCIIPTTKHKRQTNNYKYKGAVVYALEDVPQYWNRNVLRIEIRLGKQLINSYDENGFRYAITS